MTHPTTKLRQWVPSVSAEQGDALAKAADEIEAAIIAFDPMADLQGGMRRLNAAMAVANRVYTTITGVALFGVPQAPLSASAVEIAPYDDGPMVA